MSHDPRTITKHGPNSSIATRVISHEEDRKGFDVMYWLEQAERRVAEELASLGKRRRFLHVHDDINEILDESDGPAVLRAEFGEPSRRK